MNDNDNPWKQTAEQRARNESYYRGLLERCALSLGPDAYKTDAGELSDTPVLAGVPGLVERLVIAALVAEAGVLLAGLGKGWTAGVHSREITFMHSSGLRFWLTPEEVKRTTGDLLTALAAALREAIADGLTGDVALDVSRESGAPVWGLDLAQPPALVALAPPGDKAK